jgi:hypothetical protein
MFKLDCFDCFRGRGEVSSCEVGEVRSLRLRVVGEDVVGGGLCGREGNGRLLVVDRARGRFLLSGGRTEIGGVSP